MPYISQNPATEEILGTFPELTDEEVEVRLVRAEQAYQAWRLQRFSERAMFMKKCAELLRKRKEQYGRLIALEIGRPLVGAIAEIEKCALACDYYADNAEKFLSPETVQTEAVESYVRFDPIGIVLAVMPWNFPFWQVIRFAAPTLMAGNVGILKHASNVPQCAIALEEVFRDAGFPDGVFQNFLVRSSRVEKILRDPRVRAVTLTGSEYAGSQVASVAGQEIKKSVMELGGSDPFIVLADADVEKASVVATTARLQNAGQSCIAAKRFIAVESVAEKFITGFLGQFQKMVLGDPMDSATTIGPLATKQIVDDIALQVEKSVALGAKVLIGGKRKEGRGYFYEPTILTEVRKGMPVYDEEVFGPVASVIVVKDAEEAIRVANDTTLGLGSSLWTNDVVQARQIAARIDAGSMFINTMVKSDPRLPFGGNKKSGYGRELSHYGIREFVNVKTVVREKGSIAHDDTAVE